jgi:hypothetical protein
MIAELSESVLVVARLPVLATRPVRDAEVVRPSFMLHF